MDFFLSFAFHGNISFNNAIMSHENLNKYNFDSISR